MKNLPNVSRSHRLKASKTAASRDEIVRKSSSFGAAFRPGSASRRTPISKSRSQSACRGASFFIKTYLPRDKQCLSGYVSSERKVQITFGPGGSRGDTINAGLFE